MNIKKIALAAALPAVMMAAPAQAQPEWFIIDDFDDTSNTFDYSV